MRQTCLELETQGRRKELASATLVSLEAWLMAMGEQWEATICEEMPYWWLETSATRPPSQLPLQGRWRGFQERFSTGKARDEPKGSPVSHLWRNLDICASARGGRGEVHCECRIFGRRWPNHIFVAASRYGQFSRPTFAIINPPDLNRCHSWLVGSTVGSTLNSPTLSLTHGQTLGRTLDLM